MSVVALTSKRVELVAVIGTVCAFAFCIGFIYPVVALSLEARGHDEAAIGLNATASGLGILIVGFLVPRIVRKFGTFGALAIGVAISIASLVAFPMFQNYWIWLFLRLVLGGSIGILFTVGEAWINAIADQETRGRTVSIYVAAMALCFGAGSGFISVIGHEGAIPFVLAGAVILVFAAPTILFRNFDRLSDGELDPSQKDGLFLSVLRQTMVLMAVVLLFGALDGVALGLLPSYALAKGVTVADASLPIAAMAFGVVVMQIPIGLFSDYVARERTLSVLLIAVVVFAAGIPYVDLVSPFGLFYMLIFGGLSFAPYTLAMAILGDRFTGQRLAAGTALFAIMWGVGSTGGPVAFGAAMESYGAEALPIGIAFLFGVTGVVSLLDRGVRRNSSSLP